MLCVAEQSTVDVFVYLKDASGLNDYTKMWTATSSRPSKATRNGCLVGARGSCTCIT